MNIDEKILQKNFANQIQQHKKDYTPQTSGINLGLEEGLNI